MQRHITPRWSWQRARTTLKSTFTIADRQQQPADQRYARSPFTPFGPKNRPPAKARNIAAVLPSAGASNRLVTNSREASALATSMVFKQEIFTQIHRKLPLQIFSKALKHSYGETFETLASVIRYRDFSFTSCLLRWQDICGRYEIETGFKNHFLKKAYLFLTTCSDIF